MCLYFNHLILSIMVTIVIFYVVFDKDTFIVSILTNTDASSDI